jgi:hypothetical protein
VDMWDSLGVTGVCHRVGALPRLSLTVAAVLFRLS